MHGLGLHGPLRLFDWLMDEEAFQKKSTRVKQPLALHLICGRAAPEPDLFSSTRSPLASSLSSKT
jgi:hypothetical protein